ACWGGGAASFALAAAVVLLSTSEAKLSLAGVWSARVRGGGAWKVGLAEKSDGTLTTGGLLEWNSPLWSARTGPAAALNKNPYISYTYENGRPSAKARKRTPFLPGGKICRRGQGANPNGSARDCFTPWRTILKSAPAGASGKAISFCKAAAPESLQG